MHRLTWDEVTTWKARVDPDRRVIPPHLKLAILSRGRVQLAAERVSYFLDAVRAAGAKWPDRLTAGLDAVAPDYPLAIELFLNRRLTMTPDEIREAIQGYLVIRRETELKDCWQLLFVVLPVSERKTIETKTDVDISMLFKKPRVTLRPSDDPYQYVLVAYVCLPNAVAKLVGPEPKPPLPPAPPPLAPLPGRLKPNTEFHLRVAPGKSEQSLGVQAGTAAGVTVSLKTQVDGETWYSVELAEPARVVPDVGDPLTKASWLEAGTVAWIVGGGVDIIVASWALLRNDLADFEKQNAQLSLSDRITALRQRMHSSKLPFDKIIGTPPGGLYVDTIPYDPSRWQAGPDYQAFVAPDGRWVDLQHAMVGLDVLSRPEKVALFNDLPIGTNYAASTWGGDAGSAATDATLRFDATWERWNPTVPEKDRLQFYFETRAPDHELLGDLDPWEMQHIRDTDKTIGSIDDLFAAYYEKTTPGSTRELVTQRRSAVERFLAHYGFTYDQAADLARYPALPRQSKPVGRVVQEIGLFAQIWMYRHNPYMALSNDTKAAQPHFVNEMALQFLFWLEYQVIENSALVQ